MLILLVCDLGPELKQALVRERVDDWKKRLEQGLHRKVVELTGDVTPDGTGLLSLAAVYTIVRTIPTMPTLPFTIHQQLGPLSVQTSLSQLQKSGMVSRAPGRAATMSARFGELVAGFLFLFFCDTFSVQLYQPTLHSA